MRTALQLIAGLAVLAGLIWTGQGLGYFRYPAGSFMIDDIAWAYRGAALCVVGIAVIVLARTRR